MKVKILISGSLLLLLVSCLFASSTKHLSGNPVSIKRFDKILFQYIEKNDSSLEETLKKEYPQMLEITGKAVLNMKSVDMPGFFDRLLNYYSEPTLNNLYRQALHKYEQTEEIEQKLGNGFACLTELLPTLTQPEVYMHVSGFGQNVIAGDNLLSISIDKYMGEDFPLYEDFFYDFQRRKMQPDYIVPDYLTGWLMSEFPFKGNENVLLERMIYEGKIKYLVNLAVPSMSEAQLLGYTEEDFRWVEQHEGNIWRTIIERKHLYTPEHITTGLYFEERPSTFISDNAPGNLGTFIGWQIVMRYMKETKETPVDLMSNTDAQNILTRAKYKP
ncbi:gliding motility protein GldB [Parabacteroides sp. OttesenSCG-928-K15]|nr:gliding motility protein GldB [Parabacteroides sp. OttesenSCG-928-K15]